MTIYLAMTSVVALVQLVLERRFNLEIERPRTGESALGRLLGLRGTPGVAATPTPDATSTPPPAVDLVGAIGAGAAPGGSAVLVAGGRRPDGGTDTVPFVACRDVRKAYGPGEVLCGIDMAVGRGEVVTIMGPSGSGKSTLLRLINHLETLNGGEITVDGRHVGYEKIGRDLRPSRNLAKARADARIGIVFQHF